MNLKKVVNITANFVKLYELNSVSIYMASSNCNASKINLSFASIYDYSANKLLGSYNEDNQLSSWENGVVLFDKANSIK